MLSVKSEIVTASLLFSSLLLYLWNYSYWTRRRVKQRLQFPIFGDNFRHFFQLSPYHEVLSSLYDKFRTARYMGFYQYCQPGLMIRDPKLIKRICEQDKDYFLDRKSFLPKSADELWNRNLFALQGQKWRDMRNTLSPSFTSRKMKIIFGLVTDYTEKFIDHLLNSNDDFENVIEVEFKDLFTKYTTDVIATVAFGVNIDSVTEPKNEFYEKGRQAMQTTNFWKNFKLKMTLIFPLFGTIFGANIFDESVSEFFKKLIKNTIDIRKKKNIDRPDMLQLLMKAHEPDPDDGSNSKKLKLEIEDITSQALVFFLGGFETASNALCFMAYELAINPVIQDKLIEEIDRFKRENGSVTYEGIKTLEYMDMVLAETLRKWPPLLNMDRMCIKEYNIDPVNEGERLLTLKPSTLIWIPIWCLHRDPQHWPDPEVFDPERFSKHNRRNINKATYLPFGLGARSCLGSRFAAMEIKLLFFHLLSKFRIIAFPWSEIPFVPLSHSFSLASEYGFRFGLERRMDSMTPATNRESLCQ